MQCENKPLREALTDYPYSISNFLFFFDSSLNVLAVPEEKPMALCLKSSRINVRIKSNLGFKMNEIPMYLT